MGASGPYSLVNGKARFAVIDELGIMVVDNRAELSDDDWVLLFVDSLAISEKLDLHPFATLYVSDRAMSAAARRAGAEFMNRRNAKQGPVAALSSSVLLRGAVTAFNWLTKGQSRAFAPEQLEEALGWLATLCRFDTAQARAMTQVMTAPATAA